MDENDSCEQVTASVTLLFQPDEEDPAAVAEAFEANMEEAIYWSDRLHKIGIGFRHITGMTGPMPAERKHYFFVRGTDQKAILDSALERHSWKVDGYDEAVKVITE